MKLWGLLIAAALLVSLGAPAEAGKRKGAVTATIDYGVAKKVKGLSITVALANHKERAGNGGVAGDYVMTVKKGKKRVTLESGFVDTPWLELVAFNMLVQVRGGINDAELTVAPATKVSKRRLSAEKAMALVGAEADQRGIQFDGSGASEAEGGVLSVSLTQGRDTVVTALVGARSRDFLDFQVLKGQEPEPPDPSETADPADRQPGVTSSASVNQAILDEHNRYRADHCAPALTWSDKLATVAQAWADHLAADNCAFEHSQSDYGENLAAGTTGSLPPSEVVAMWYREIDDYDWKHGDFSMSTGHFTQVVWKETKQVGCGMAQCNGMDVWVCNYDPYGNVDGGYKKNVLPTTCK